jgi:hypothetical protein
MVKEADTMDPFDPMHSQDFLSLLTHSGVPPHELHLKVGAICTIMRNMSIEKGLVKNSRVVIHSLHSRFVEVRTLQVDGNLSTEIFSLPRIRFNFHPPNSSWTVDRLQFPLRLAYAATFHSCLGLTLDRAAFDLRSEVFSHGQLYTAISRIRTRRDGLVVVASEDQADTKNVVYAEMLS